MSYPHPGKFQLFKWDKVSGKYLTTLTMRVLRACTEGVDGMPHPYHPSNNWNIHCRNQQIVLHVLAHWQLVYAHTGPKGGYRWKVTNKGRALVGAVDALGPSHELKAVLVLMELGWALKGNLDR